MPDSFSQSEKSTRKVKFDVIAAAALGLFSFLVFGWGLQSEKHFADESAYTSQSYFWNLFIEGKRDDPQWLSYQGYDLPPLPKYLIGAALQLRGTKLPTPNNAKLWYDDTSTRFEDDSTLIAARLPIAMVGAIGCVAIFSIGTMVWGRDLGILAALLLTFNPLYRMSSQRAMSDAPAEAFMLLGLACFLGSWKAWLSRTPGLTKWVLPIFAGVAFGLSLSSKFSGALGLMVSAAWLLAAWMLMSRLKQASFADEANSPSGRFDDLKSKVKLTVATLGMGATAALVFIVLNPFLTAHPTRKLPEPFASTAELSMVERLRMMTALRLKVSRDQQQMFSHNAVTTPSEKLSVTAVQGFGRFGPFGPSSSDSEKRFEKEQDWGAFLWIPAVAFGFAAACLRGREQLRRGEPSTLWLLALHFAIALIVVTAYLPMAWDRYFLPIQAPSTLLGAFGILSILGYRRAEAFV